MQVVYDLTNVMAIVIMAGETARRGPSCFAVNGAVVLKGIIWVLCLGCLIVTLRDVYRNPATLVQRGASSI